MGHFSLPLEGTYCMKGKWARMLWAQRNISLFVIVLYTLVHCHFPEWKASVRRIVSKPFVVVRRRPKASSNDSRLDIRAVTLLSSSPSFLDRFGDHSQCDQIWRKFSILAKSSKSLAVFWGSCLFGNILDRLWQSLCAIEKGFIDGNGQMMEKI